MTQIPHDKRIEGLMLLVERMLTTAVSDCLRGDPPESMNAEEWQWCLGNVTVRMRLEAPVSSPIVTGKH